MSRATASNAFNRPDRLSAELRDRLLTLAEEIGYAGPDPRAAGLRRGRVGAIGVVLADRLTYAFSDPAALQILDGIAEAVATADIALLLLAGDGSGGGPARRGSPPQPSTGSSPTASAATTRRWRRSSAAACPQSFVDQSPGRSIAAVDLDEEGGVRRSPSTFSTSATAASDRHAELRRRPRSGPIDADRRAAITFTVVRRRLDAAIDALAAAGVDPATVLLYEPDAQRPGGGRAGRHLAARPVRRGRPR